MIASTDSWVTIYIEVCCGKNPCMCHMGTVIHLKGLVKEIFWGEPKGSWGTPREECPPWIGYDPGFQYRLEFFGKDAKYSGWFKEGQFQIV